MTSFWYPISALLLPGASSFASVFLLRRLLSKGQGVDLLYAGDRMWPAVRHGQIVRVEPPGGRPLAEGMAVVAAISGAPELLRVVAIEGETLSLRGDADPSGSFLIAKQDLLGLVALPPRRTLRLTRDLRRSILDAREAVRGKVDSPGDDAGTVRFKYDSQAPFYLRSSEEDLPAPLLETIRRSVPPGGKIFVAGSGTGRECFALMLNGWEAKGVDFSGRMVELAREEARRRGLQAAFQLADLRSHDEPPGSIDAVLFTFDVFSFIPTAAERAVMLARMATWLKSEGVVLLSARRIRGIYDRWILLLQLISSPSRGGRRWGDSHSRWIDMGGVLHRSFVKVFTERSLRREIGRAGFHEATREGGHTVLRMNRP